MAWPPIPQTLVSSPFPVNFGYTYLQVSNTQSTATPTNFQQYIQLPPQLSLNTFPLRFYADPALTQPLYAWYETPTTVWVLLPNGIPANSSINIYFDLDEPDGVYTGMAPYLSPTYGQYDNGVNVFSFYDNFAGTTLSSKWVSGVSGGTATVNNGLSLIVPQTIGDYVYVASASPIATQPIIVEAYMNGSNINVEGYRLGFGLVPSQTYLVADSVSQDHVSWQGTEVAATEIVMATQTGTSFTNPSGVNPVDGNYHIWGIEWLSGEAGWWYNGYSPITTTTSNVPTDTNYLTLSYYAWTGLSGTPASLQFQWVRTRAYPPNGIKPSVSFV